MFHVETRNLTKTYTVLERPPGLTGAFAGLFRRTKRAVHAVQEVSLSIRHGERVGYIGPNGAGKSTTIKMIAGLLVPTSGECTVSGRVPWKQRTDHVKELGAVFGQRSLLWWDLPVLDSLQVLRQMYDVPEQEWKRRLDDLVSLLDIASILATPTRQLSLGQKMRCELVAALLHAPSLVILDEPTIGLDAPSKIALREFLLNYNRRQGATLFLTTHDLDDIEAVCDRVIVINHGRLVFDGNLQTLRAQVHPEKRIVVDFNATPEPLTNSNIRVVSQQEKRVTYSYNPGVISTPEALSHITALNGVADLSIENAPIDEVITAFYGSSAP
jgi:ABC-2 type transport system ATP-binding protein